MGTLNLAAAGAIGGIGQAMIGDVQHQRDLDKMEFDQAREVRLRQMEETFRTNERVSSEAHADTLQDKNLAGHAAISQNEITKARELQKEKEGVEHTEKGLDRASREKIAGIKAAAVGSNKKMDSPFIFKNTPASQVFTPEGMKTTPAQATVSFKYGPAKGQTFVQKGTSVTGPDGKVSGFTNNFYPPEVDPKTTRRVNPEIIEDLLAHPDKASEFVEAYGYLPGKFVNSMQSQVTQQGIRGPQPQEPDDADDSE